MDKFVFVSLIIAAMLLFGCTSPPAAPAQPSGNNPAPVNQAQPAPANTSSQPAPVLVGNDSDAHGCKGSAGYTWCDVLGKCIRPWEENCTAAPVDPLVAQAKTYCGKDAKVYICGGNIRVTGSTPGGVSTIHSNGIAFVCPPVAPDQMSPKCKDLLVNNNCTETEVC